VPKTSYFDRTQTCAGQTDIGCYELYACVQKTGSV